MKRCPILMSMVGLIALCAMPLSANEGSANAEQVSGDGGPLFELRKVVISAGGSTNFSSGGFALFGSLGQSVATAPVSNGDFRIRAGFWSPLAPRVDSLFSDRFELEITRSEP